MKLTVAICTWNRSVLLGRVLDHLDSVRLPKGASWELLVVDNNSTDDTRHLLEHLETSLPLRVLIEPRQGKSAACNRVLREARGEIIAWMDDDVLPDSEWLVKLCEAFDRHDADFVFGPIRPKWLSEPPPWFSERFNGRFALLDYGQEPFSAGPSEPFFGANYACKAEIVRSLGGFREDMGPNRDSGLDEDTDLYLRALNNGRKVVYEPLAGVSHMIDSVRCTKRFHRLRMWKSSPTYYRALLSEGKHTPRWLRIPRYLYRIALDDLLSYGRAIMKHNVSGGFYYELRLIQFAGVFWECLKNATGSSDDDSDKT